MEWEPDEEGNKLLSGKKRKGPLLGGPGPERRSLQTLKLVNNFPPAVIYLQKLILDIKGCFEPENPFSAHPTPESVLGAPVKLWGSAFPTFSTDISRPHF